jgi:hypothetical protein
MSNQYGLTIDNMAAYELVLPNGTVTNVTESNEDLWFALRVSDLTPNRRRFTETTNLQGGGNNFVSHLLPRLMENEVDWHRE